MSELPYLEPSDDFSLNVGLVSVILETLSETKRGKKVLNFERIQIFLYLVLRPHVLNKILRRQGKSEVVLSEVEFFSINSISSNVDPLFDRKKIKLILQFLGTQKFLDVTYTKNDGFLFNLSEAGTLYAKNFHDNYFEDIRRFSIKLSNLQSISLSKLNADLNSIFKQEA